MGLNPDKPTLLVVGGSLGCRTFNDMMMRHWAEISARGEVQVVWQTGKRYEDETARFMASLAGADGGIQRHTFIERMNEAYAAADLVIARSGAGTVSELALLGKPVLFVPSPGVAEDHQTRNALALAERGAAEICTDAEAVDKAIPMAMRLLADGERLGTLAANIKTFATPDAAERIVDVILKQFDD
jgi:UDP-N-acetylglucosamine--N-acetylmuramyl-(pentapeptide) pyrophosphoryl-undecaprenol N-acetylglucosamine transferase